MVVAVRDHRHRAPACSGPGELASGRDAPDRDKDGAGQHVVGQVEPEIGRAGIVRDVEVIDVQCTDRHEVAVLTMTGRRGGTDEAGDAGVISELTGAGGQPPAGLVTGPLRQLGDVGRDVGDDPVPEAGRTGRWQSWISLVMVSGLSLLRRMPSGPGSLIVSPYVAEPWDGPLMTSSGPPSPGLVPIRMFWQVSGAVAIWVGEGE